MNGFYLSDDKFSEILGVSLVSLFEQSTDVAEMNLFIIENKISEQNKARLQQIAHAHNRSLEFIPMQDLNSLFGVELYVPTRLNIVDYARLCAASILPSSIDKVIQIDCDVIFQKSIKSLWETAIGDAYAAMINEGHSPGHREVLGLSGHGVYSNSGIMVINLKKWRESNVQSKFASYIQEMKGYIPVNAQGTINAVLDGRIAVLPAKFNVHPLMYAFSYKDFLRLRKPTMYYPQKEYDCAREHPAIIHFMTCFYMDIRPWQKGCKHPKTSLYLAYRDKTPWRDQPLWPVNKKSGRRMYCILCHVLPKSWAIALSSYLYVKYIPKKHFKLEKKFGSDVQRAQKMIHEG
jgi:Lipopolysaccharide biosynthesis proteins, LPS:glycosyltransferases